MRYLQASKTNRYVSWITLLSIFGLAIGVAALILVLSVFDGFEEEVRSRLLQSNAHVIASLYPGGFDEPKMWARQLSLDSDLSSKILAVSPLVHTEGLVKKGPALIGVLIKGINPQLHSRVQSLASLVHPSSALEVLQGEMSMTTLPEVPAVILGEGLYRTLNLERNANIDLIRPKQEGRSSQGAYKVIGIYRSGLKQYDDRLVIMSLPAAQAFHEIGTRVTSLALRLKDGNQSTIVSEILVKKYPTLTIRDWQSMDRRFFDLMDAERFRVGMIVALVGIVAGFNILTTVFVSVAQKQSDISVLKALGASTQQLMKIFFFQSFLIGIAGALLGAILAALLSMALRNFPYLKLPEPYLLNSLPVKASLSVYVSVGSGAVFICLIAGIYPAWIASHLLPCEGLRGSGKAL